MEPRQRVLGIGGFFFSAADPEGLARWYADHLGVDPPPSSYEDEPWRQTAGVTVFAAMPGGGDGDNPHLGPSGWGLNFRVADLDAFVQQLRASDIDVDVDPETYPNGRFAGLHDPEGNPIQLWQPS